MTNKTFPALVLCAATVLCSCGGKKKQPLVFYDTDVSEDTTWDDTSSEYADSTPAEYEDTFPTQYGHTEGVPQREEVIVPFKEEGGVKTVEVKVNGKLGVDMILDSGCSGTLISLAEARYLYDTGRLTADDFLGTSQSQIADGSIVENMVVNLKQIVIADQLVCTNVTATVASNTQAPLLLGNEVLNRSASYAVDNVHKVIIFTLKQ